MASPLLFPQPLKAGDSNIVFIAPPLLVGQMCQFHRLQNVVDDQRRSKSRAQAKKEHPPSLITAQCLHGGVIDNLYWPVKGLFEIKSHPAAPKVERFAHRMTVHHWAGIAN